MKTYQFNDYSKYYDTLYQDKNYPEEAGFIVRLLRKYGKAKKGSILSLGCGTGTYEILLAKKGYKITGIDISQQMLDLGFLKIKKSKLESKIELLKRDVRNFTFRDKFDNAMAMFNIAGYQIKNEDFEGMLRNVSRSLKKGGLFIFDCWYLPAVLKDRPTDRVKKFETKEGKLVRLTKSLLKINENIIEINFDVLKIDKNNRVTGTNETHFMRYWSLPELNYFLEKAGFSLAHVSKFMDDKTPPSDLSWDIMVVAKKNT